MVEVLAVYYHKRIFFVALVLACFVLVLFYKDDERFINYQVFLAPVDDELAYNDSKYLVSSSKCRIPDLDPFSPQAKPFYHPEKYTKCTKLDLLTYITKSDNIATLHVDTDTAPSYTKNGVSCCYANVIRHGSAKNPDDGIKIFKCNKFKDNVTLDQGEEFIKVECEDVKTKKRIYENTHAVITIKPEVKLKLESTNNSTNKTISVLFVGIDSISRLNLIRSLPKTYAFLENHNWIPLKGYNKIGDNTFPNLMAILTGYNESRAYSLCDPKKLNRLDNCSLLWFDFKNFGYVTAYAEDESSINTFNYRKKGFTKPPTDYYLRPYMIASEKLKTVKKDSMTYCTGPETSGERILNVAKDFAVTFKEHPKFGFFWMNTFSHNELMSPTGMDRKIQQFLQDITDSGVLEDSFVIFFSDHGIRFGEIRYTPTGWLEERLPFIYISVPDKFKTDFPTEFLNLKKAVHKLTNPYDLHMTLQHILVLSGFNFTSKPSDACPNCKSLFTNIESDRSCEAAMIQQHWCTCSGYTLVDHSNETVKEAANFIVGQIQEIIHVKRSDAKCAKYTVSKIISSSISEKFLYKNSTYLLLVVETKPKAVFEATVLYDSSANNEDRETFILQGGVSRLDWYYPHSKCVDDAHLKMYCYCR